MIDSKEAIGDRLSNMVAREGDGKEYNPTLFGYGMSDHLK